MPKKPSSKGGRPSTIVRGLVTLAYLEAIRWGNNDKALLGGKIPALGIPRGQLESIRAAIASGKPIPLCTTELLDLEGKDIARFLTEARYDLLPVKEVFDATIHSEALAWRVLARADIEGIAGVVRLAAYEPRGTSVTIECIDSPRVAPLAASWLAQKRFHRVAADWLVSHSESAAIGLIPVAVGEPGPARALAEDALRFLATVEREKVVRDVAARYGAEAVAAVPRAAQRARASLRERNGVRAEVEARRIQDDHRDAQGARQVGPPHPLGNLFDGGCASCGVPS